jgi:hypothetical protein
MASRTVDYDRMTEDQLIRYACKLNAAVGRPPSTDQDVRAKLRDQNALTITLAHLRLRISSRLF